MTRNARVLWGDAATMAATLPAESIQCVVTSPPYWQLRDYGHEEQIGLEATPDEYIANLVEAFRSVRAALCPDGAVWLNLGDTYMGGRSGGVGASSIMGGRRNHDHARDASERMREQGRHRRAPGLKRKDLVGIPWRVALALQADGWWLRSEVIWHKPNPLPESVKDRPTRAHESLFLLTKSRHYYYDPDAIRTDTGANARSVWKVVNKPWRGEHSASFPMELALRCVSCVSRPGDTVLDPFAGTGTTLAAAVKLGRQALGIELSRRYENDIHKRLSGTQLLMPHGEQGAA